MNANGPANEHCFSNFQNSARSQNNYLSFSEEILVKLHFTLNRSQRYSLLYKSWKCANDKLKIMRFSKGYLVAVSIPETLCLSKEYHMDDNRSPETNIYFSGAHVTVDNI